MEAPDIIGNAKVICYTLINGNLPIGVSDKFVNDQSVFGAAICEYKPTGGYYLFYCGNNWVEFYDGWHETIEDAKDQVEAEFAGVINRWNFK